MAHALLLHCGDGKVGLMQRPSRPLFWSFVGTLLGFGLISAVGLPCLLLGAVLLLGGLVRYGGHGAWLALICFGAVPLLILLYGTLSTPACAPGVGYILPPTGVTTAGSECAVYPASNHQLIVLFGGAIGTGIVVAVRAKMRARMA